MKEDDLDFWGNARELYLNGEVYDVIDTTYDEIVSHEMASLMMAQLHFFKGYLELQIKRRHIHHQQGEPVSEQFMDWEDRTRRLILIIERNIKMCAAKQRKISWHEKHELRCDKNNEIIRQLQKIVDRDTFLHCVSLAEEAIEKEREKAA